MAADAERVFRAVADGTRRAILELLRGCTMSAGEIVARFRVSQPTISQHLAVLAGAGLVDRRREGRRVLYRLRPERVRVVRDWSEHFARFWPARLQALGTRLDELGVGK